MKAVAQHVNMFDESMKRAVICLSLVLCRKGTGRNLGVSCRMVWIELTKFPTPQRGKRVEEKEFSVEKGKLAVVGVIAWGIRFYMKIIIPGLNPKGILGDCCRTKRIVQCP